MKVLIIHRDGASRSDCIDRIVIHINIITAPFSTFLNSSVARAVDLRAVDSRFESGHGQNSVKNLSHSFY